MYKVFLIFSAFQKILKRKLSLKFYIFLIEKNTFQNKISCLLKALQYVPNQREQLKSVYGKINAFLFCCLKLFKLELTNMFIYQVSRLEGMRVTKRIVLTLLTKALFKFGSFKEKFCNF